MIDSASWAFEDWLEAYDRYGVVQGISIACKAFFNRLGLPLLTINRRSNDGSTLTFFMILVSCETEESFTQILLEFKSAVLISPSLWTMD